MTDRTHLAPDLAEVVEERDRFAAAIAAASALLNAARPTAAAAAAARSALDAAQSGAPLRARDASKWDEGADACFYNPEVRGFIDSPSNPYADPI